jgi:hypothetical protein
MVLWFGREELDIGIAFPLLFSLVPWQALLWIFSLFVVMSIALGLSLCPMSGIPLHHPIPAPPWNITSGGMSLPKAPPWQHQCQHRRRRNYHHYFLVRCELRRALSLPTLPDLPWEDENDVLDIVHPSHICKIHPIKSTEVDKLLEIISPIDKYERYLQTVRSSSMISSVSQTWRLELALVAACDLSATFKLADLSWSPPQSRQQFILNLADNHHIPVAIDTGASVSLMPNASDFIQPIKPTNLSSLQGLGSTSRVDGQGIVEWQI